MLHCRGVRGIELHNNYIESKTASKVDHCRLRLGTGRKESSLRRIATSMSSGRILEETRMKLP